MDQTSTLETTTELTEDARKYMAAIGRKGGAASKGRPHVTERAKRAGVASGAARRAKKAARASSEGLFRNWNGDLVPHPELPFPNWDECKTEMDSTRRKLPGRFNKVTKLQKLR